MLGSVVGERMIDRAGIERLLDIGRPHVPKTLVVRLTKDVQPTFVLVADEALYVLKSGPVVRLVKEANELADGLERVDSVSERQFKLAIRLDTVETVSDIAFRGGHQVPRLAN